MLDDTDSTTTPEAAAQQPDSVPGADPGDGSAPAEKAPAKKAAATKAPAKKAAAKKAAAKKAPAKKAPAKKATATSAADETLPVDAAAAAAAADGDAGSETAPAEKARAKKAAVKKAPAKKAAAKKAPAKKAAAKKAPADAVVEAPGDAAELPDGTVAATHESATDATASEEAAATAAVPPALTFQPPDPTKATPARRSRKKAAPAQQPADETEPEVAEKPEKRAGDRPKGPKGGPQGPRDGSEGQKSTKDADEAAEDGTDEAEEFDEESSDETGQGGGSRRRRRRGGRRRRKSGAGGDDSSESSDSEDSDEDEATSQQGGRGEGRSGGQGNGGNGGNRDNGENGSEGSGSSRRRRRRRRAGEDGDGGQDDPENTVTRVRTQRSPEDEITALSGSTRLEAKKQRRREGREAGRRRAPIVSEAEFLARREAVDRVMVIRQRKDLTQIAVLEDKVLVEHYVARESQTSLIGNVYLGRVQNVLPSMEAAFIDIGKGRNAVLYAGEVNWDSLGAGNGPRKIEQVLKSGQPVLVQVTKDPIGHKGARLTSQISLPGRFLVYVPDGTTSGISRKLPDTERNRLKSLLKEIVPGSAGVIVRTAAEGASEDELTLDVERLTARWEEISSKVAKGNAPALLYGEPDLTLKVVRDLFTEDFGKLVVSGDGAWDMVEDYVEHVAPDLSDRLERYDGDNDVFAAYRIDEQIAKGLDRKVWLPSGGSLIIDRTEAMTVVDVNTGKFTGSGGNLEETVTKNNLEAAEEIVRQLRLRDIGGIIVVDFIDMVLESNRDLVLRRMVECLGRDRTRHQVAEVTSLGLVQMTRKRIGTGLLEAFSESCDHCQGRGLTVHHEPVESKKGVEDEPRRGRRSRGRGKGEDSGDGGGSQGGNQGGGATPSPKDVAAMAKPPTEPPAERSEDKTDSEARERAVDREQPAAEQPAEQQPASAKARDEQPAAPQQQVAGATSANDEPATGLAQPEAGTATSAPKVVTTTRRRSARRPAGQPSSSGNAAGGGGALPQQTEPSQPEPVVAAVAAVSQPEAAPAAPPRVVTTSRRGVARRPSGPPVADPDGSRVTGPDGPPPADPAGSPDGDAPAAGDAPGQNDEDGTPERKIAVHVPVKSKGSRKR